MRFSLSFPARLFLTALVCTVATLSISDAFAEEHSHGTETKEFTSKEIKPGIFFLQGKGGNLLLSKGEDGVLLVDDDYKEMSDALEKVLAEFGGKEQVKILINTHWHGDHTGNNVLLGENATVLSHDNVRSRLSTKQEVKLFGMKMDPMAKEGLPDLTYAKRMMLYFNSHELEIAHYPKSHTDGDSVVYFNDINVVHTGDLLFNGMFPFVDIDNGGDVVHYTESVGKILKRIDEETVVVPGHGPLGNKEQLKAFHEMLEATTAEVREMIAEGLSKKEAQERGLDKKWESWGNGALSEKVWIGLVFDSVG